MKILIISKDNPWTRKLVHNLYKTKYDDLDTLHKQAIEDREVKTDVSKFIKANKKIFNRGLLNQVRKVIPARVNMNIRNQRYTILVVLQVL